MVIYKPSAAKKTLGLYVPHGIYSKKHPASSTHSAKTDCHVSATDVADGAVTEHPVSRVSDAGTRLTGHISRVPRASTRLTGHISRVPRASTRLTGHISRVPDENTRLTYLRIFFSTHNSYAKLI